MKRLRCFFVLSVLAVMSLMLCPPCHAASTSSLQVCPECIDVEAAIDLRLSNVKDVYNAVMSDPEADREFFDATLECLGDIGIAFSLGVKIPINLCNIAKFLIPQRIHEAASAAKKAADGFSQHKTYVVEIEKDPTVNKLVNKIR